MFNIFLPCLGLTTKTADEAGQELLQEAMKRHRKQPDIPQPHTGGAAARSAVPMPKEGQPGVSEEDLQELGFVPSRFAVPEAGQTSSKTYRHPSHNYHLHAHDDTWMMHRDKHPSMQMLQLKADRRKPGPANLLEAIQEKLNIVAQGTPHVVTEGIPGLGRYLYGQATGAPTYKERLEKARREGADKAARALLKVS